MDYLLRTPTQSDMDDALIAAGVAQEITNQDNEVVVVSVNNVSIDEIGAIPPILDIDDNIISPGDPRWHTNIRVTFELTQEQIAFLPTFDPLPTVPYRVFA